MPRSGCSALHGVNQIKKKNVKIYKTFLPKVTLQIGKKKLLELKRLKILYRGHVISDFMESSPQKDGGNFIWPWETLNSHLTPTLRDGN